MKTEMLKEIRAMDHEEAKRELAEWKALSLKRCEILLCYFYGAIAILVLPLII